MPVPTAVEKGAFKATGIALLQMTAQSFSPAYFNRMHDFTVSGRQRISVPVIVSGEVEYIGHFPSGPTVCRSPLGRGLHELAQVRHESLGRAVKSFGIDHAVTESALHSESKLRRSGNVMPS